MNRLFCGWLAAAVVSASAAVAADFPLENLDLATMKSGWGKPVKNLSIDRNPLKNCGRTYARGIGTHAPSEFAVTLNRQGVRFSAMVGVNDEVGAGRGEVKFRVVGDGKVLAESPAMKGGDPAVELTADLSGIMVAEFAVDDCGEFGFDHADWYRPTITMKDGSAAPVPFSGFGPAPKSPHGDFAGWTKTPPLGWNSFDCYGSAINEEQFRANVDYQSKHLLRYGYEYAVVDIRWTVQNEKITGYNPDDPVYTLDQWGRYIPAPNRFPSSAGGKGFKPLADYVHSKGLKFGIHIMRGVPKEAVARKLPVKGAEGITCDRISNGKIECFWLRDNCTVLRSRYGAQEYYDSIFGMYADWGVDFVKVDDLSAPYHRDEIEMIRRAIDKTGRKIVLSTSPGKTPVKEAAHVQRHANMWRMVDDLWDSWHHLDHLIGVACDWLDADVREGTWPDCDMIPLGKLGVIGHYWSREGVAGRPTNLTRHEQRTLMNLFGICRSPMMIGADLPQLKDDPWTFSLLTDETVLAANRDGRNPRVLLRTAEACAIESDNVKGGRFLMLINLLDKEAEVSAGGVKRTLPPHGSVLLQLKR